MIIYDIKNLTTSDIEELRYSLQTILDCNYINFREIVSPFSTHTLTKLINELQKEKEQWL